VGIRHDDHVAPYIRKKLVITSPTSGGRSVGIVRSRTQTTEFSFNTLYSNKIQNEVVFFFKGSVCISVSFVPMCEVPLDGEDRIPVVTWNFPRKLPHYVHSQPKRDAKHSTFVAISSHFLAIQCGRSP
jgi:hypothetical protein